MNQLTSLIISQALTHTLLIKKMDRSLSIHGLSFTEFSIMHSLAGSEGGAMSRISLAESVGLTASGVTRLLAPMLKNHIVDKAPNARDVRQSMVSLSDVGKELYSDALVSLEHSCLATYALLNKKEIEQLQLIMQKIKC